MSLQIIVWIMINDLEKLRKGEQIRVYTDKPLSKTTWINFGLDFDKVEIRNSSQEGSIYIRLKK